MIMIDAIIAIIIKVYYHARKSSRIMLDIYALTYLYHPIDDREIVMFTWVNIMMMIIGTILSRALTWFLLSMILIDLGLC